MEWGERHPDSRSDADPALKHAYGPDTVLP